MSPTEKLKARLGKHSSAVVSGCIEWNGYRNSDGYGRIFVDKKGTTAHRISYKVNIGDIPSGICVMHKCDNRACINPEHLTLGTHQENMQDMKAKGRAKHFTGNDNARAKLSNSEVFDIRNDDRTHKETAGYYGVSITVISHIRQFKSWKHIVGIAHG
jgi:hypothetical protein